MSKRKRKSYQRKNTQPNQKRSLSSFALTHLDWDSLASEGYIPLSQTPEIVSAVNKIASLIGTMTIHLMQNTPNGDQRIMNPLSRLIDIHPNRYVARNTFIASIVRTLLLDGDGNAVIYPRTQQGYIEGLYLLPPGQVSFIKDQDFGYYMNYMGHQYTNEDLCHIVLNPDPYLPWKGTGYRASLRKVADTLNQAQATKQGFMESKWKPSIIVKVDAMTDEFSSSEGREKLLEKYITSSKDGKPWLIPADGFDVITVKPLSLTDLAINESVELDKKTVSSLLDIPSFILGVGTFNKDEWNNFINTRIRAICTAIQQAFTNTLLINPDWYFRFNYRSLYAYDIQTLSTVGCDLYTRGILTGNEVRDSIGYSPKDGLDELVILENYIPQGMIGDQKKLLQNGGGKNGTGEDE